MSFCADALSRFPKFSFFFWENKNAGVIFLCFSHSEVLEVMMCRGLMVASKCFLHHTLIAVSGEYFLLVEFQRKVT